MYEILPSLTDVICFPEIVAIDHPFPFHPSDPSILDFFLYPCNSRGGVIWLTTGKKGHSVVWVKGHLGSACAICAG